MNYGIVMVVVCVGVGGIEAKLRYLTSLEPATLSCPHDPIADVCGFRDPIADVCGFRGVCAAICR